MLLQQSEQALEALAEAIRLRPEEGAPYLQRALVHATLEQADRALADSDAAILLLEDPALAHAQKSYFLAALEELDEALEEYRRALEGNPDAIP